MVTQWLGKMSNKKVIKPYNNNKTSKKEEVKEMFNNISKRYDFLNHFLSFGIDKIWRKKAIQVLGEVKPKKILDVATGTGDFAIASLKLNPEEVIGVDISNGMLNLGKQKIKRKGLDSIIKMHIGDSENLSYESNYFDGLTVGFGVRNYENLEKGLGDMLRVIKPGGKIVILEFSKPKQLIVKTIFGFYSKFFIPFFGKLFSKDKRAYQYLPESVIFFPEGQEFLDIMVKVGYNNVKSQYVSFGIATIYSGIK